MDSKIIHYVAMTFLWVGGLNWGLVGLFGADYNLVVMLFGSSYLTQVVYILVGLSAVYTLATHKDTCQVCMDAMRSGKKKGKRK